MSKWVLFSWEFKKSILISMAPLLASLWNKCLGQRGNGLFQVFWYSFSEAIPIISIALKVILSSSDGYEISTSDWLWFDVCQNAILSKINITMTTIKSIKVEIRQIYIKTLKVKNRLVCRKIARKKLHQNFQEAKCDIKQHFWLSGSILMKVSVIIIYIVKIMWWGWKKILSSRSREI